MLHIFKCDYCLISEDQPSVKYTKQGSSKASRHHGEFLTLFVCQLLQEALESTKSQNGRGWKGPAGFIGFI